MEPFVLRRTSGVRVRLTQMTLLALFGVLGLIVGEGAGSALVALGLLTFAGYFIARALRMQATADDDGLHIQGALRERIVPWDEIAGADVVPGSMVIKTWHVRVVPTAGRTIHLADLYHFGRKRDDMPTAVMAARINQGVRASGRRPLDLE